MKWDGSRLRALRVARKWDQHRLAENARSHGVGVTQSQVSRYENGQEPSARNALALASALNVSPGEFFNGADSGSSSRASEDDEEGDPVSDLMTAVRRLIREEIARERS